MGRGAATAVTVMAPAQDRHTAMPVSVIMPVRNEERHLAEAVGSVLGQDYPGELELVLAVGPSKDKTQQIAEQIGGRPIPA